MLFRARCRAIVVAGWDVVDIAHDMDASERPREAVVAEIAARQHGVITRAQLAGVGFGRGAIAHRVAEGRLHRVRPTVYAVGHARLTKWGRWMAAVLGCGEEALLSHRSAAALHGLGFGAAPKIDVTVPGRSRHGQTGIVVHLVRSLHDEDRTACEHVPVTSVPRTLLDLAEVVVPRQLRRAFEEAERLDLLDLAAISRLVRRSSGRHGLKHVRAILSDAYGPVPETHSELERRFVRLCREAGIPPPATNVVVAGYTVDAYWPDHRVVAELDGFAFHHTRHAFERDRARDAELQLAGYRVLRITARRLERDSAGVARALLSLLV